MKKVLIIFLCLFISVNTNETLREFLSGAYEALDVDPSVNEKCFAKDFDFILEDIKMFMSAGNVQAFKDGKEGILQNLQKDFTTNCSFEIMFKLLPILKFKEGNIISILLSNLIEIEKLFVKYYKSDSKGGREFGRMIGGIFKFTLNYTKDEPEPEL